MRLERAAADVGFTDFTVTHEFTGGSEVMSFSDRLLGDLVVDFNRQTAAVTTGTPPVTSSVMGYYTYGSTFPTARTGTQTFSGIGDFTIKWRERWE